MTGPIPEQLSFEQNLSRLSRIGRGSLPSFTPSSSASSDVFSGLPDATPPPIQPTFNAQRIASGAGGIASGGIQIIGGIASAILAERRRNIENRLRAIQRERENRKIFDTGASQTAQLRASGGARGFSSSFASLLPQVEVSQNVSYVRRQRIEEEQLLEIDRILQAFSTADAVVGGAASIASGVATLGIGGI